MFDWADTSVKERPDGETRELGWLLGYGASKRRDVPGQMIHRQFGVEFAIHIPADVIARSKQRLIDVEPNAQESPCARRGRKTTYAIKATFHLHR